LRPASFRPVQEASGTAAAKQTHKSGDPDELVSRGLEVKSPTIVAPWGECVVVPIFSRFVRVDARPSCFAFAQVSTQYARKLSRRRPTTAPVAPARPRPCRLSTPRKLTSEAFSAPRVLCGRFLAIILSTLGFKY